MKKLLLVLAWALGFSVSNLNAFNQVVASNTNYEVVDKKGDIAALCKAVAKGNLEEVNKLLKAGVDVNEKSNGLMPIHYAAKYNRVEILKH